jgi:hypothetical protein
VLGAVAVVDKLSDCVGCTGLGASVFVVSAVLLGLNGMN